jgi:hypothetical protein
MGLVSAAIARRREDECNFTPPSADSTKPDAKEISSPMSRRPADFTQADVARALRAAKQVGAAEVEVRVGKETKIIVRLAPSTGQDAPLEPEGGDIVL